MAFAPRAPAGPPRPPYPNSSGLARLTACCSSSSLPPPLWIEEAASAFALGFADLTDPQLAVCSSRRHMLDYVFRQQPERWMLAIEWIPIGVE